MTLARVESLPLEMRSRLTALNALACAACPARPMAARGL